LGRNKISEDQKKLTGNPGKREEPPEHEVESPSLRCPPGLSKIEKRYWRTWAPDLIEIGKLTVLTVPSFVTLIRMKARLDQVNAFISGSDEKCAACGKQNNRSLLQEIVFVDGAGVEHISLKESAYSKLSRDLTVSVCRLEKSWGLTADSMAGNFRKKKTDPAEDFLNHRKGASGRR
jgi:hypothetical protein